MEADIKRILVLLESFQASNDVVVMIRDQKTHAIEERLPTETELINYVDVPIAIHLYNKITSQFLTLMCDERDKALGEFAVPLASDIVEVLTRYVKEVKHVSSIST